MGLPRRPFALPPPSGFLAKASSGNGGDWIYYRGGAMLATQTGTVAIKASHSAPRRRLTRVTDFDNSSRR